MACSIIIPAKNEGANLSTLLPVLREKFPGAKMLVVCPLSEVRSLSKKFSSAKVFPCDSGFGPSVLLGLSECKKFPAVVMDADLSHSPADADGLLRFFQEKKLDLAIGSRYCPGGKISGWSPFRRLLSESANSFSKKLLKSGVSDLTSGFRVYSKKAVNRLVLADKKRRFPIDAYPFQLTSLAFLERSGLKLGEFPIEFRERKFGVSKTFSLRALASFFKNLVSLARNS